HGENAIFDIQMLHPPTREFRFLVVLGVRSIHFGIALVHGGCWWGLGEAFGYINSGFFYYIVARMLRPYGGLRHNQNQRNRVFGRFCWP
ncbi:hypothetical protein, partial [Microcoleus sp. herbarium12]|uniref:hypothetical protein n=1 Tax=Microcoleus sp. herbarium12 TaxID=3055437 RepID=UPI002FD5D62E